MLNNKKIIWKILIYQLDVIMEQKEIIKFSILNFLVLIVTCETRYHPMTYILEDAFNGDKVAGFPAVYLLYRHKEQVGEGLPTNNPFNEAQYNKVNQDKHYTDQYSANTGRPVIQEPEISPYTSNLTPSRQYMNTYPVRVYEKINHDKEPALYNKPFIKKVDPGFGFYDESDTVRPHHNKVFTYRTFKKPTGQIRDGGIGNYYKQIANKNPYRNGYLVVNPTEDNSTGPNDSDSYGEPKDYFIIDVKNVDDYNYWLR